MNCVNCGNPMNEGDRFCMNCGFAVAAAAPALDVASAVDAAPAVDVAPVVEPVPSMPAMEAPSIAPAEVAPVMDAAPVVDATPVVDAVPAMETTPVAEPVPAMPTAEVPTCAPSEAVPVNADDIQVMGSVPAYVPQEQAAFVPVPVVPVPDQASAPVEQPVASAPVEQPVAPAPVEQPVAPAPIDAVPSAPMQDPSFTTTEAPVDYLAEAKAKKAELENMFQRKSWKDESANNGGIVNRGPVNR